MLEAIVERKDGHKLRVHIASMFRLADILNEMGPREFTLRCGRADDGYRSKVELEVLANHRAMTSH